MTPVPDSFRPPEPLTFRSLSQRISAREEQSRCCARGARAGGGDRTPPLEAAGIRVALRELLLLPPPSPNYCQPLPRSVRCSDLALGNHPAAGRRIRADKEEGPGEAELSRPNG